MEIDWDAYKEDLLQNLSNERLWEMGCFDEYNPHTENIQMIEEEIAMLEDGDYESVLSMHDVEYFEDFIVLP